MTNDDSNPVSRIARNASWLTLSFGITMFMSLFLRMYMPRILGPEQIGQFFYAESMAQIAFAFLPMGISVFISRKIPPNPGYVKKIFTSILGLELFVAIAICGILWATLSLLSKEQSLISLVMVMSLYGALLIFNRDIGKKIFIACDEVKVVSKLNILGKASLVTLALVILSLSQSVHDVAWAFVASEVITLIVLLYLSYRRGYLLEPPSWNVSKEMLKVGLPFHFGYVMSAISSEIDITMLGSLTSHVEVGYFGAATKLIGIFLLLVPIISSTLTPALSIAHSQDPQKFVELARGAWQFMLSATFPFAIAIGLFSTEIVEFLYGDAFPYSPKIVAFKAPHLTLIYLNVLLSSGIALITPGRVLTTTIFMSIVINVTLNNFLAPLGVEYWGPGGGGIAVTLTTLLSEIVITATLLYAYPLKVMNGRIAYTMIFCLIPSATMVLLYDYIHEQSLVMRIIIFLIIPFYLLITRLIRPSELKSLWAQIRSQS